MMPPCLNDGRIYTTEIYAMMDVKEIVTQRRSGPEVKKWVAEIAKDVESVDQLMDLFFDENLRICQSASWYVGIIAEVNDQVLYPYLDKMIINLHNPKHNAIVRNTIRAWQFMTIPEDYSGEIYDICSAFINSPKEAIAFRVFSMTVCYNIGQDYPELLTELRAQLVDCLNDESRAVFSRSRNIIKLIDKKLKAK